MTTLQELLAQKHALDEQIREMSLSQRTEGIAKVKAIMAELGLTMSDIGSRSLTYPKPATAGRGAPTGAVRVKYRNPATGDSWSGRGLKPRWMVAALAGGAKISDFLLDAQPPILAPKPTSTGDAALDAVSSLLEQNEAGTIVGSLKRAPAAGKKEEKGG